MKWAYVIGISFVVAVIAWVEWPRLQSQQRKAKAAFVVVALMGWGLAILLVFVPQLPGPDQWLQVIYKPLGRLLDK